MMRRIASDAFHAAIRDFGHDDDMAAAATRHDANGAGLRAVQARAEMDSIKRQPSPVREIAGAPEPDIEGITAPRPGEWREFPAAQIFSRDRDKIGRRLFDRAKIAGALILPILRVRSVLALDRRAVGRSIDNWRTLENSAWMLA